MMVCRVKLTVALHSGDGATTIFNQVMATLVAPHSGDGAPRGALVVSTTGVAPHSGDGAATRIV